MTFSSGGPKWGVLGGGQKVYVDKVDVFVSCPQSIAEPEHLQHESKQQNPLFSGVCRGVGVSDCAWCTCSNLALPQIRSGSRTVGGLKWTKLDLFRQTWTKLTMLVQS